MTVRILIGDCRDVLRTLPDESVHCVVTSPPYFGLRDYGVTGQIGLEPSPDEFVDEIVAVFREVRRVLRSYGTCWINLGDSYATQGGKNTTPHTGAMFADRTRGAQVISRSKRMARGAGRWGGGNSSAAGLLKSKDLIGAPWMVAFALRADGWWLRQDIIWSKPNPMPESVTDRCTKSHEHLFLLTKNERYYFDSDAIREDASDNSHGGTPNTGGPKADAARADGGCLGVPAKKIKIPGGWDNGAGSHGTIHRNGRTSAEYTETSVKEGRNKRSVWSVATSPFPQAHFATFPPALIEPCIKAGCPAGGTVLDPFGGAGTTGLVADRLSRDAILIELNPEYAAMAERRICNEAGMLADVRMEEPTRVTDGHVEPARTPPT
jgi:DNA modification methylase